MNTRAKGRKAEKKAVAILEAQGWLVELVKGSSKWNKNVDFFGLWDIIAVKKGKIRWVQVKCNRPSSPKDRHSMKVFPGPGDKELWVFYDGMKYPVIRSL